MMAYIKDDLYVGRSLGYYGEYSEEEINLFRQIVSPEMTVLDVGANIGAFTIWFGQNCKAVHAFEPQRIIFQILCTNIILNGLSNVFAHHAGVAREGGERQVPLLDMGQPNNHGALSLVEGDDGEPTRMLAIDDMRLNSVGLIKVDVEGMEIDVLEGAKETIARCRPLLYVEVDRDRTKESVPGFLEQAGYVCHMHTPHLFNKDNFRGEESNIFGIAGSFNMLAIPGERYGQ